MEIIRIVKERKFKYICFFWIIIGIQFVIGSNLELKGYSIKSFSDFVVFLVKTCLLSSVFIIIHYCFSKLFNKIKIKDKEDSINEKYKWGIYFLIILICWIPILLAFYPAIINYDGSYQIEEFIENRLGSGNPIIHSLLLSFFYVFGADCLNCSEKGILLYVLFQMSIMAGIFSYNIKFIEVRTKKKWLRNISLIFYAIFPFNQLFPLMTTKDTIFAGLMLLFIINCNKLLEEKYKVLDYVYMIILTVLMLLFRHNGIYALLVLIPFVFLIFIKDKDKVKKLLIVFLISIFIYKIADSFLIRIVKAEGNNGISKLTIFSQSIAKISKEKENELTEEEKIKISYYYKDYKLLGKVYLPNISDNAQRMLIYENVNKNKKEYIELAMNLFKKYPTECIDACLNTSRGYWYICDNSFNQIGHKKRPNEMGCLELMFNPIRVKDQKYKVQQNSYLPKVKEWYKELFCKNEYRKIPLFYIFFQPAIYFYMLIAFLLYSIYKRNKTNLLIGIFLFLYFGTCLLGPVAIIRYIYGIIILMPLLIGNSIDDILNKREENYKLKNEIIW